MVIQVAEVEGTGDEVPMEEVEEIRVDEATVAGMQVVLTVVTGTVIG